MAESALAVETVHLDLPALAGALGRRLRSAGVPVSAAREVGLVRALAIVRPDGRRRLYWTARAVLVSDPAQVPAFDDVFAEVFGAPRGAGAASETPRQARTVAAPADDRPRADDDASSAEAPRHAGGATAATAGADGDPGDDAVDVPLAAAGDDERLSTKSFDALDAAERARLYEMMAALRLATPVRLSRRHEVGARGRRLDLRRTLRGSMRTAGDPVRLARRRRRERQRRLVLLCDISGSMEPYARAYLQFLACAAASGPEAEAFAFATRLTRLTRALRSRNPERAIRRAAAAAPDWSSGTRIGDALRAFNDRHGRRGMARGAIVVILSDGWERGDPALVGREMRRLARLAHRIVWVNPRAGASSFRVAAGGMVAALPHCDALVSGHTFAALAEVIDEIGAERGRGAGGAPAARRAIPPDDEPEPWASATPVAGSSVAMPVGDNPRRGNTSPGWRR
ncbi:MAG: VWA domain-containing protein [Thermoleophilia bacterium]